MGDMLMWFAHVSHCYWKCKHKSKGAGRVYFVTALECNDVSTVREAGTDCLRDTPPHEKVTRL